MKLRTFIDNDHFADAFQSFFVDESVVERFINDTYFVKSRHIFTVCRRYQVNCFFMELLPVKPISSVVVDLIYKTFGLGMSVIMLRIQNC